MFVEPADTSLVMHEAINAVKVALIFLKLNLKW